MSWGRDEPRGYHHGNLREALIHAALELIAKKGAAGFTFAEAARFAGVSPAAPYRHFRDRDELMASVALRGFEQFEAALARAWDDGRPDAFVALERLGKAYLEFARTQPAYYSAMFEAGVPVGADPALRGAGDRAFAVLRAAAERLCADDAGRRPSAGLDGRAPHLGDGARHGVAVRIAATARSGRCRCRRRSFSKRRCWSICAGSASRRRGHKAAPSAPSEAIESTRQSRAFGARPAFAAVVPNSRAPRENGLTKAQVNVNVIYIHNRGSRHASRSDDSGLHLVVAAGAYRSSAS